MHLAQLPNHPKTERLYTIITYRESKPSSEVESHLKLIPKAELSKPQKPSIQPKMAIKSPKNIASNTIGTRLSPKSTLSAMTSKIHRSVCEYAVQVDS